MDLYFERHDGQAVTCDDFRAAMADGSAEADPSGAAAVRSEAFGRWYEQAGTPVLTVESAGLMAFTLARPGGGSAVRVYRLVLRQATAPTPGQPTKLPVLLPIATGLLLPGPAAAAAGGAGVAAGARSARVALLRKQALGPDGAPWPAPTSRAAPPALPGPEEYAETLVLHLGEEGKKHFYFD